MAKSALITAINKKENKTTTENGAKTFVSTQSAVLDFFANGAAKRANPEQAVDLFSKALAEDTVLAIITLFHIRNIRNGQGERKIFRSCMEFLSNYRPELFSRLMPFFGEFGRWDDLVSFTPNKNVGKDITAYLKDLLNQDLKAERPSILAKWLPSANTSSKNTVSLACLLTREFGMTPREYRKTLSGLRQKLNLVESLMTKKEWSEINYSHVPSNASKIYRKAFAKNDAERYKAFLEKAVKGEVKINASTLFPYDIVNQYLNKYSGVDNTLEAQWNALPDWCADAGEDFRGVCVVDVSGSMGSQISNGLKAMAVSISLGLYISERAKGLFQNHFFTFNTTPTLEKVKGATLAEKVRNMKNANWGGSTNLQATFDLILSTALKNKLPQTEMPTKVFIISDMEMNSCDSGRTNFKEVKRKYKESGYEMPEIIFWNVMSRNQQVPVKQDTEGVKLVSGCSPSIFKSIITSKTTTPYDMMLEVLNAEQYIKLKEVLV
jgi:hypothetical protein